MHMEAMLAVCEPHDLPRHLGLELRDLHQPDCPGQGPVQHTLRPPLLGDRVTLAPPEETGQCH